MEGGERLGSGKARSRKATQTTAVLAIRGGGRLEYNQPKWRVYGDVRYFLTTPYGNARAEGRPSSRDICRSCGHRSV